MDIKREAAYHEAGHVVIAKLSMFHDVVSGIDLSKYGSGYADISLSKSKLIKAGKKPDASSQTEKVVTQDFAIVMTAGYAAEQIAAEKNPNIVPNRRCADPDYLLLHQSLKNAGLSKKTDVAEASVRALLLENWEYVERIASAAFDKGGLTFSELAELCVEEHD